MLFFREPKVIFGVRVGVGGRRGRRGGRVRVVGVGICPEPEMLKMGGSGNPVWTQYSI